MSVYTDTLEVRANFPLGSDFNFSDECDANRTGEAILDQWTDYAAKALGADKHAPQAVAESIAAKMIQRDIYTQFSWADFLQYSWYHDDSAKWIECPYLAGWLSAWQRARALFVESL